MTLGDTSQRWAGQGEDCDRSTRAHTHAHASTCAHTQQLRVVSRATGSCPPGALWSLGEPGSFLTLKWTDCLRVGLLTR